MGRNLAKTPMLALFYAALIVFGEIFIPYSGNYSQMLAEWEKPLMGYLFLIGYALWISIIIALVCSTLKVKLMGALVMGIVFILLQWVMPNIYNLMFGEPSGVMSFMDIIFTIALGAGVTILTLVLSGMVLRSPEASEKTKYKIKKVRLIVWGIVLPIIHMVMFFVTWYFFAWRHMFVRAHFGADSIQDNGFVFEMIDMLLYNIHMVPFALLQGVAYIIPAFVLLLFFAGKRVKYIIVTLMMFLSGVIWRFVPNPVIPQDVGMALIIQRGILLVAFGVACTMFLYSVIQKTDQETATAPAPAPAKAGKPGKQVTAKPGTPATAKK